MDHVNPIRHIAAAEGRSPVTTRRLRGFVGEPALSDLLRDPIAEALGLPGRIQYTDPSGNQSSAPGTYFSQGVPGVGATYLEVFNEVNDEAADFEPRGLMSVEYSDTDHSAHITGWKSRGTHDNQAPVQVGDYLMGLVSHGYSGVGAQGGWERAGGFAQYVQAINPSGHLSTISTISSSIDGVEHIVYAASVDQTVIHGSLQVVMPNDSGFAPVQGKLTTHTAASGGFLILYDANGVAYKVAATPA